MFSSKKILLLFFIVVILVAIPFSVYVVQKQQQTKTKAATSTSLSFNPPKKDAVKVGETITFDIMLDPAANTPSNQVSFAKLVINYDPLKLATADAGLSPTTAFPSVLEEPSYTPGSASVTLSIGSEPVRAIQAKTKIASISFKALESADTTKIVFAASTQVLSVASEDQAGENVLSSSNPAIVTIISVSPTPTPTTLPLPSTIVCTGLVADRSLTGVAPYFLTFTGSGTASVGNISKASFNFGDGIIVDVTQGEGIGTSSISIKRGHSYEKPGTYTASLVLTSDTGALSALNNCTQTITVNSGVGGIPTPSSTESGQPTPQIFPTEIIPTTEEISQPPIPTIEPPGPSAKLIGVGIAGIILSIIGGIIFFTL